MNILGTGRAETDINHPSDLSPTFVFLAFMLPCFPFVLRLERERVVTLGAWAQSFPSIGETGSVIRISEWKEFLREEGFEIYKDGEG